MALERPDGLLVANLLERGYAVYPVNPKAVDRYRDRHQGSGAKDDARDAWVLANILRTDGHRFAPLGAEGEVAAELRLTARAHRDLVQEGTRLANQLHACLADYYPAAPTLFGQLGQPIALAFLQAFPTPEAARGAGRAGILAWCKAHRYQPRWAEALWEKLDAPALAQPNAGVVRARSRQAAALLAVLAAQREHERALAALLGRHPDGGLFLALPGAGTVLAAELLGELGEDRAALPRADDLRAVGGTAPVTIQSGKRRAVVRRQACNRALHASLIQFARSSVLQAGQGKEAAAWAGEVYRARRAAGESAQAAYRAVATRWAGILWAVWTRREPYDHRRYEQARRTRALPRAS